MYCAEVHSEVFGAEGLTRWYVVRIPLLTCAISNEKCGFGLLLSISPVIVQQTY